MHRKLLQIFLFIIVENDGRGTEIYILLWMITLGFGLATLRYSIWAFLDMVRQGLASPRRNFPIYAEFALTNSPCYVLLSLLMAVRYYPVGKCGPRLFRVNEGFASFLYRSNLPKPFTYCDGLIGAPFTMSSKKQSNRYSSTNRVDGIPRTWELTIGPEVEDYDELWKIADKLF